jgi:hypothetical protein
VALPPNTLNIWLLEVIMLWEKIHIDSKTRDISRKDNHVVNRQSVAGVAVNLILFIALLLSGCVSKTVGESYIVEKEHKIKPPEIMEVSEPKSLEVSEPKSLEVSEPKSLEVSEPKSLESGSFQKGRYTPAERENPAYDRCAKEKGFDDQYQCALEALGITEEEIN